MGQFGTHCQCISMGVPKYTMFLLSNVYMEPVYWAYFILLFSFFIGLQFRVYLLVGLYIIYLFS